MSLCLAEIKLGGVAEEINLCEWLLRLQPGWSTARSGLHYIAIVVEAVQFVLSGSLKQTGGATTIAALTPWYVLR